MKTLISVLLLISIAVGGYTLYTRKAAAPVVETPAPAAKLNITEVCKGALAYMTFANAADADAFVAACVRGEHPDVIERYKQDMGLGEGAAI